MPAQSSPTPSQDTMPPTISHPSEEASSAGVGQDRYQLSAMSDSERELHIKSCGWLMEDAMRRWHQTGDFSYRGEADRWRLFMEEAIRSRSPAQVARMEAKKGLR